jgi:hypothetical protein
LLGDGQPAYLLLTTVAGPRVIRWMLLAFTPLWPFPYGTATKSDRRFRVILRAVLAILGLARQWVWISPYLGRGGAV